MTLQVPNLDAMDHAELMTFWQRHQNGRCYRELFPDGGKGSRGAAGDLACYASNLATARSCRLRGDIAAASMYEQIADGIYDGLPAYARW